MFVDVRLGDGMRHLGNVGGNLMRGMVGSLSCAIATDDKSLADRHWTPRITFRNSETLLLYYSDGRRIVREYGTGRRSVPDRIAF